MQELKNNNSPTPVPHEVLVNSVLNLLKQEECKETKKMLYERGQACKRFMKEFLDKNPVSDDERIAVVCHSMLIASLTASGVEPSTESWDWCGEKLKDFYWMNNCEIQPYNL
jgi:hypothetical protein